MPKGSRAVQLNRGHVSISRATADDMGLYCCVTPVSFLLELTVAQARELAQDLLDYASESHHPDVATRLTEGL